MKQRILTIGLLVWLILVMGAGAPVQAPVVRDVSANWSGNVYAKVYETYLLAADTTAQAITQEPGDGRFIGIDDLTITSDTACYFAVIVASTGTTVTHGYLAAYSPFYVINGQADAVSTTLQLLTSTAANVAVTANYTVVQ